MRRHALLLFIAALVLLASISPVQAVRVDESYDYVDNNSSDVDTHADHGTESSFLAMQAGPDSSFNTLTEANTGSAATNYQDFVDQVSNLHAPSDLGTRSSFPEEQDYDTVYDILTEADSDTGTSTWGKTTGSGSSYRTTVANEVRLGVFAATSSGEVASIVFYGRGSSATNCKGIITDSSGNLLANGVGAAVAVSTTAGTKTLTYSAGSRPIVSSGTTYWIGMIWQAAGRVYYDSTTGATSRQDTTNSYTTPTSPTDAGSTTETWRQMYANINNINYGVDLEVGWTAAQYSETNEMLCIYGGTQDAEALKVDVWTGSWTNVIADTAPGWNNVSVSSSLTSAAFEIRFVDARTTPDASSAGTWQVEGVLLHCWSAGSTNYEMDVEFQWTTADFDESVEGLCVYAGTQDAESLLVQVRNGGAWTTLISDLIASQWNNVSIAPYLTTATLTIRFLGGTESSDTTQSTWQIDCALIHVYSTSYSQSAGEALPISEHISASRLVSQSLADVLGLSDFVSKSLIAARAFGESLALGSSVATVLTAVLIMSQVVGMAAATTTSRTAIQTLYEMLPVLESMGRSASLDRALIESLLMQNSGTQEVGWMTGTTTTDDPGGGGGGGGGGADDPPDGDLIPYIISAPLMIIVGLFTLLFVFARGTVPRAVRTGVRVMRLALFVGLCAGAVVGAFVLNDMVVTSLVGEWLNTVLGFSLLSVILSVAASLIVLVGVLYVAFALLWRFRRHIIG